jgi:phospholipid-binding lipoprotein MlaA
VPDPVKTGLDNFVQNLDEPHSLVNNTLQGKWHWALNAGGRFVVNTTVGILGLIDVADMMGMPRKQDDFNEVLGYYGVPNGPYFMAPFAGPYVTREIATDWVDGLYFPRMRISNMWITKCTTVRFHQKRMMMSCLTSICRSCSSL